MPRPRLRRYVSHVPSVIRFKPQGVPASDLEQVTVSVEGLEALRLVDRLGLSQEEGAAQMNVSRQTFGRVLAQARAAVAEALVDGKMILIEGGDYDLTPVDEATGPGRGRGHGRRRRGRS